MQALVATKPVRVRPTNRNLPDQVVTGNAWRGRFIPTTYQWLSTSEDPFRVNDHLLREALLPIAEAIYGDNVNLGLEDIPEDKDAKVPAFVKTELFRLVSSNLCCTFHF
jgi:hypothetical protein